jgi:hydroxymethylglutaryl-CoA synthase
MKGILSYGAYIPYNRLQRKKLKEFYGASVFAGEKAVASFDEDSVSMGVEAAFDCLQDFKADMVESIHFATTSGPYREKSSIPTIVKALDLPDDVQGIESAHTLRGGTSGMLAAINKKNSLIISADCRLGAPNGMNEQLFGDGAAAFLFGEGEAVIAQFIDGKSLHEDVVGQWRSASDTYTQNWEDRFVSSVFLKNLSETVQTFSKTNDISPASIAKVIISGPGGKAHHQAAKKLGFKEAQIQDPLLHSMGAAGNAHAPMMLVAALEEAKPGDRLLILNFSEGTDILLFEVTDAITKLRERKGIKNHLRVKNSEFLYSDYLKWKGILTVEPPRRPETGRPSAPAMHRNYHQNLGFYGSKCRECGTPQFPKQRICVQCQAKDQMEEYRFVGRDATVTTYTIDYLAASPAPPSIIAVIDFNGGGRVICEVTDCDKDEMEIGMEVEMTFRRLYEAKGVHNYFWKARPKR